MRSIFLIIFYFITLSGMTVELAAANQGKDNERLKIENQKPLIEAMHAYLRFLPKHAENTALYMTIYNHSSDKVRLNRVGVFDLHTDEPLAEKILLHETILENHVKKMRDVDYFEIPAKGILKLKPGDNHVMVIKLKHPLKLNDEYNVRLHFSNHPSIMTKAKVVNMMLQKDR